MEENNKEVKIEENGWKNNKILWVVAVFVLVGLAVAFFTIDFGQRNTVSIEGCPDGVAFNINTGEPCPEETATAYPEDCDPGDLFSQTTGVPCDPENIPESCLEGETYDQYTGEPCPIQT